LGNVWICQQINLTHTHPSNTKASRFTTEVYMFLNETGRTSFDL